MTPPADLYGVRIVLLMPTHKHCVDVHARLMQQELEGQWAFLGAKVNRSRWTVDFPGGSVIQFFGAREADSSRGLRCDWVAIDEADDVEPSVADAVVEPWFSEPWSFGIKTVGGTPRRGRYGLLYRTHTFGQSEAREHRRYYSLHATYRDAPENVNVARIDELRDTMPLATFKREYECDFDSAEGLVYSVWSEKFHVREPHPDTYWSEIIIAADHGWEDPAVFLVIGLTGSGLDVTAHVLEEFHEVHADLDTKAKWLIAAVARYSKFPQSYFADPSRPDMSIEYAKKARVRFLPANNAIKDGIDFVGNLLAIRSEYSELIVDDRGAPVVTRQWAQLYVHPRCVFTRWEMTNYRRKSDPNTPDVFMEDIVDKHNHCMDSLRYGLFTRLGPMFANRTIPGHVQA